MAEPPDIVVDASVVVKWFTQEDDREMAIDLMKAHVSNNVRLVSPYLMPYEVSNALHYNSGFSSSDKVKAVSALFGLNMRITPPTVETLTIAIQLSEKYSLSIYDSIYLSMAEDEGIHLVTADKKLFVKIKDNHLALLLSSDRIRELCLGILPDKNTMR